MRPRRPGPRRAHRRRSRRRGALALRGTLPFWAWIGVSATVFAGMLALWLLATSAGWVDPLFLPAPGDVLDRLIELGREGDLWTDIGISTYRIMVGFAIATAMAIPLGVLAGSYRLWEAAIEPLVDFIRYMPVVAFVPLTIVWVGTDDTQKFLIIWLGTFFQQVLLIMDNVRRIPGDYIDVGRTLGLKDRSVLRRIVVPAAGPGIWDSMRISLGWAWTWLVLAELVAATSGLGYRIVTAQRFFQTETIIGYLLVLGVLGLLTDQLMKASGRRLFRWAEERR
ncbi:MAG: ABC transporter permease [Microbacterium sp.]|uniref:ABC transporter permease n=1 Tax=Microbacterium sp. TaxID=51671 RepID=UPI003D6FBC59